MNFEDFLLSLTKIEKLLLRKVIEKEKRIIEKKIKKDKTKRRL